MAPPILELAGIQKRFGSAHALRGVDFALASGEVHALLGENGAGKSTLMHIAYGMLMPDGGSIRAGGRPVTLRSPRQAIALGIGMVHQHFTTVGPMTVEENLWLAAGRRVPWTAGRVAGLERLYQGINPTARVEELSVAAKQRLEIVKALAADARVLLLDEPTAVLAPPEVDDLLAVLRIFAEQGGAVALITHKLREVFAAADRVTVLRRGEVTLRGLRQELTEESLARAMIGADLVERADGDKRPARDGTGSGEETAAPIVASGPDFQIRGGEIIGLAAVEGNGQRGWLRAIAGVEEDSEVRVTGPVAFIPEDRTTEGLIPAFSLTENVALGLRADPRWARGPWLSWPAIRSRTAELIGAFDIRGAGPDAPAASLSGGNQQKLVFARALELGPRVLVAENPTRGLDVHATREVHRRLRATARAGAAVVLYSADLDEVLALAERVFVMYRGVVREAPAGTSRDVIGRMMLGVFGEIRRMSRSTAFSRLAQSPLFAALLAATAGLTVLAAGLAAAGYEPVLALGALWRGAFGSWYALTSATLVRATPLIVLGIGFALAMQAGALNIGAEGQFYAGAIAATWVALHLSGVPRLVAVPVVLASGAVAGALWILGPVVLRLRFGVLEVISTLLLNFVAEALVSLMVQGPLQEVKHIYPESDPIPMSARLPLVPGTRLHLGLVLALLLAGLAWLVIRRTRWGFALRAAGAGPRAAEVIGRVRVPRTLATGLLISGSLAGLGGAIEITGVTYALFQNLSPGYGFQAIAVALLARLNPLGIVAAGLLFGALEAGAGGMQREAGVPAVAVDVVQAVVIVVTLLSVAASARATAAATPETT